jgi:hypothetical protein
LDPKGQALVVAANSELDAAYAAEHRSHWPSNFFDDTFGWLKKAEPNKFSRAIDLCGGTGERRPDDRRLDLL